MNEPAKQTQFDQWSGTYDRDIAEDGLFPFDGYERVLRRVLALVDPRPGQTILELGPGTGNLTARLVAAGAAVWGLDFSAGMIALARQKVPGAILAQGDLLSVFPPGFRRPFDRVVATYVFHEFPLVQKISLLRRLFAEHLDPAGQVVVGDIGFADEAHRERIRLQAGDRWDEEYYWLADETERELIDCGFSLVYEQVSSCGAVLVIRQSSREH